VGTSPNPRGRFFTIVLFVTVFIATRPTLFSASARPRLRSTPGSEAPVTSLLTPGLQFEIEKIQARWALVKQGGLAGWVSLDELPLDLYASFQSKSRWRNCFRSPILRFSRDDLEEDGSLSSFVQYAVEDQKKKLMMQHPSYRHRISSISSEWGPFFYRRTHQYYVRGITCTRLFHDQFYLSLAKRRIFYHDIFGSLWSDDIVKRVIDSNHGLLGVETLFGKGREYFMELSFRF